MSGPHSAGDLIGGRYEILGDAGEGGMQYVYAAKDHVLKRQVALKTPKNDSARKRFQRSAIVSARVTHPNVAKTLDYVDDGQRQYLVEELIAGTDLDKALLVRTPHLDPYLAARIFHHLAKGLAASHHAGVVHRDLKPSNVMVTGGYQLDAIKITDFGIAKMADEEIAEAVEGGGESISASRTVVGALPYMAPEAIETPREVGKSADVWSIGAMMYELLTGNVPYGKGLQAVTKIIAAAPPEFPGFMTANPQFATLSKQLIQIVLQCLQKDPATRPTADTLVEQCGMLCYPVEPRFLGYVREIRHRAWGFVVVDDEDVFFHFDCVYGDKPVLGDNVMLSKFRGGGAWRALPVVKMQ
ncbi:MAG: protein kinase [Trichlorobacter sp.]|uniref:serine/threonine-protein kinase n=1 Tax=Trichlorobacter sp. TaxID=2911007 RepID=UPI00256B9CF4|nr:serine/threonine-protein kinase [Trichlorobacter sp.]MDK9718652.1 protein kinase [Trichlorobacter sp.]